MNAGLMEPARSPSPEPIYDAMGKRLNTREQRFKEKMTSERNSIIEIALRKNPMFRVRAFALVFVLSLSLVCLFFC